MSKILMKITVFFLVFTLFFAGTVVIGRYVNSDKDNESEDSEVTEEENVEEPTTVADTQEVVIDVPVTEEPTTEQTTESTEDASETDAFSEEDNVSQPEELTALLAESGRDYTSLESVGCNQLIIVDSEANKASIYMYEKDDTGLWVNSGLDTQGFVGANGVSSESYEGSGMTPAGFFSVGEAFYIEDEPQTGLSSFHVTENTYWVDDPDSPYYNQKVELEGDPKWDSAEHMISYYDAYIYGFVINFNMDPVVPGKGSAIFFHVGYNSTAGCIAVSQDMMLQYLAKLDASKNPYIIMQ